MTTEAPSGLRERKRVRTRDTIAREAMVAFLKRGYENVTLDEIAAASDVHKRTLLRYFPTKVHLILHTRYSSLEKFEEQVAARGKGVSVVDIWEAHVIASSRAITRQGAQADARRMLDSDPSVTAAYLAIQARYQELIASEFSRERKRDPDLDTLAKVVAAALVGGNYSVAAAIMRDDTRILDLEKAERQVIQLVRKGLLGG